MTMPHPRMPRLARMRQMQEGAGAPVPKGGGRSDECGHCNKPL